MTGMVVNLYRCERCFENPPAFAGWRYCIDCCVALDEEEDDDDPAQA